MAARCEDFHAIDLASLRRLKPGHVSSINWSRAGHLTGQISIEVDSQCACLTYRNRQIGGAWQEAREVVSFTETGTCFGGRRRWFECPGCGRPCRMLYGGGRFLCRLCLRLRYASQYESAWGRARIRAQKLRMRLGGSPNLLEAFPTRAKHMQRRTYARLRELDIRLLNRSTAELAKIAQALGRGRLTRGRGGGIK